MRVLLGLLSFLLCVHQTASAWETVESGLDPNKCTYRLKFTIDSKSQSSPNGSGTYYLYQKSGSVDGSSGDTAIHFPYVDSRDASTFPHEDQHSLLYRYPFATVFSDDFQARLASLIEHGYSSFPNTPSPFTPNHNIQSGSTRFILSERWTGDIMLEFAFNVVSYNPQLMYDENDGIEPDDILTLSALQDVIYLEAERNTYMIRTDVDLNKVELEADCGATAGDNPESNQELKAAIETLTASVVALQESNKLLERKVSVIGQSTAENTRALRKLKRRGK